MSEPGAPYVIVGGGPAGAGAARLLAERGHEVIVLTEESREPYDRTVLSKSALTAPSGSEVRVPPLWGAQEWRSRVTLRTATPVARVDRSRRVLTTAAGEPIPYAGLLLATGAQPRRLDVLATGGHVIRRVEDVEVLRAELSTATGRIVVVGAGVLGLEVAASLHGQGHQVEVIEAGERILGRGVPEPIATWLCAGHTSAGIRIRVGSPVDRLPNDLAAVVVAVGVRPRTDLAETAGLACDDGVVVDAGGRTSDPHIFAAGDCARWDGVRHEAYTPAGEQGVVAARSMLGESVSWHGPPTMWSDQGAFSLHGVGTIGPEDDLVVRDVAGARVAFGFAVRHPQRITGAFGVGVGPVAARPVRAALRVLAAGGEIERAALTSAEDLAGLTAALARYS